MGHSSMKDGRRIGRAAYAWGLIALLALVVYFYLANQQWAAILEFSSRLPRLPRLSRLSRRAVERAVEPAVGSAEAHWRNLWFHQAR
jgi:hypothetical protein